MNNAEWIDRDYPNLAMRIDNEELSYTPRTIYVVFRAFPERREMLQAFYDDDDAINYANNLKTPEDNFFYFIEEVALS